MDTAMALGSAMTLPDTDARDIGAALPRVYRGLIALGARPDEAEDAAHDAAERALASRVAIDRMDGWLFVVAVRAWRRRRVRDRVLRPLDWSRRTTPGPSADRVTLIAELQRLTSRQREVLVARYVLGLSQKETAAALGIAQGTVTATQAQATKKLRERLGDDDAR